MPADPPSSRMIDQWIEGTLPADLVEEVERYFDEHPEALPELDLPQYLNEATAQDLSPDVTGLINFLKDKVFAQRDQLIDEGWLDLMEPTDDPDLLGMLEHYEVLEVIATTGMGTLLKARDPVLKRLVALKILSPAIATNAIARKRFLREARAMAALEHENILPIYGIYADANPWFAMRFIEGGSLQDALDAKDPHLETPEFLESLASQMGEALQVAHAANLVHRDIKPANILLDSSSDRLWLADFGIARSTEDPALTYGHAIAGTPRYMSPEQASGEVVDQRTDLFSLGSVMYHCATGIPPFDGSNSTAILHRVIKSRPAPISKFNPKLPAWLRFFIEGLLDKNPDGRPDVFAALKARKAPSKVPRYFLGLLLISALIAGGVALVNRSPAPLSVTLSSFSIKETGATFSDLPAAIKSVGKGQTISIRGSHRLTTPLITRRGMDFSMEAVDGSEPVIEFDHQGQQGIYVDGSLRVRGIRFRSSPNRHAQFEFLHAIGAREVIITDCHFEDPTVAGWSTGIAASATGKTVVTRCHFEGRRLHATQIMDGVDPAIARGGDLTLEDCTLNCHAAAMLYSRLPGRPHIFRARNNLVQSRIFIGCGELRDFLASRFEIEKNVVRTSADLITIKSDHGLADLKGDLRWDGKGNVYERDATFLRFQIGRQTVETLAEMKALFPMMTNESRLLSLREMSQEALIELSQSQKK